MQTCIDRRVPEDPLLDAWFALNYRLQEEAFTTCINKDFIEQWILRLFEIIAPGPQCFWLFMARLTELGLFCAATYVDCCEFEAADELLENPDPLTRHMRCKTPMTMRRPDRGLGSRLSWFQRGMKNGCFSLILAIDLVNYCM